MGLPFDLVIPLLGIHGKNPESPVQKNLCTPMFIAALYSIAKCWKQPKCPSANEWIKELIHLHIEVLFIRRKEGTPTFFTAWLELENCWEPPCLVSEAVTPHG